MKTVNVVSLIGLVSVLFTGSVMAEPSVISQNIAKRPLLEQSTAHADQAWVGASLKTESHLHASQARTNLQFVSKRAYVAPMATE